MGKGLIDLSKIKYNKEYFDGLKAVINEIPINELIRFLQERDIITPPSSDEKSIRDTAKNILWDKYARAQFDIIKDKKDNKNKSEDNSKAVVDFTKSRKYFNLAVKSYEELLVGLKNFLLNEDPRDGFLRVFLDEIARPELTNINGIIIAQILYMVDINSLITLKWNCWKCAIANPNGVKPNPKDDPKGQDWLKAFYCSKMRERLVTIQAIIHNFMEHTDEPSEKEDGHKIDLPLIDDTRKLLINTSIEIDRIKKQSNDQEGE